MTAHPNFIVSMLEKMKGAYATTLYLRSGEVPAWRVLSEVVEVPGQNKVDPELLSSTLAEMAGPKAWNYFMQAQEKKSGLSLLESIHQELDQTLTFIYKAGLLNYRVTLQIDGKAGEPKLQCTVYRLQPFPDALDRINEVLEFAVDNHYESVLLTPNAAPSVYTEDYGMRRLKNWTKFSKEELIEALMQITGEDEWHTHMEAGETLLMGVYGTTYISNGHKFLVEMIHTFAGASASFRYSGEIKSPQALAPDTVKQVKPGPGAEALRRILEARERRE